MVVRMVEMAVEVAMFTFEATIITGHFFTCVTNVTSLQVTEVERGSEVAAMLELDVPEEMLMERLINRGKTSGRADDNAETIKKRLDVYNSQTAPLIEWYDKEGLRNAVKGYGPLEEINAALCAVIDKL